MTPPPPHGFLPSACRRYSDAGKTAVVIYNKAKRTLRILGVVPTQQLGVVAKGKLIAGAPAEDVVTVEDKRPQGELDAAARRMQNKMCVLLRTWGT